MRRGDEASRAVLVLADGTVFEGEAMGALAKGLEGEEPRTIATGEIVFNTCLSGYQEVLTDPSYAGQVIAFTYPHIGNYGVSPEDEESGQPFCRGVVVRDITDRPSNWRSAESLEGFLVRQGVAGITGIDTRRLTRHIRQAGAMPCALGTAPESVLLEAARREPGTEGVDLVSEVTTTVVLPRRIQRPASSTSSPTTSGSRRRSCATSCASPRSKSCPPRRRRAKCLPASRTACSSRTARGTRPRSATSSSEVGKLVGEVPVFGICLGHQLLAAALGGQTFKMSFGHHGGNHPVKRLETGTVEITSQNHGYAVADGSVPDAELTHVNLNDGVVEGLRLASERAFSVQYHPEAGPGPHDARYLFEEFRVLMEASR